MATSTRLQPMDLRDLLDETFDLYKIHFKLFFLITAVVYLPFQILWTPFEARFLNFSGTGSSSSEFNADVFILDILLAAASMVAAILPQTILGTFPDSAVTVAVSESFFGRTVTPKGAYGEVLRRLGAFLKTIVPLSMAAALGMVFVLIAPMLMMGYGMSLGLSGAGILLILAGFILMLFLTLPGFLALACWISLSIPVFIIEQRTGWETARRTTELMLYRPFKVIVAFFCIFLIQIVLIMIAEGAVDSLIGAAPSTAQMALKGALTGLAEESAPSVM